MRAALSAKRSVWQVRIPIFFLLQSSTTYNSGPCLVNEWTVKGEAVHLHCSWLPMLLLSAVVQALAFSCGQRTQVPSQASHPAAYQTL